MATELISQLSASTTDGLDQMYGEIGYTSEESGVKFALLQEQVQQVLRATLEQWQAKKKELERSVTDNRTAMSKMLWMLGRGAEDEEEQAAAQATGSLQERVAASGERMRALETEFNAVKQRVGEGLVALESLYAVLGTSAQENQYSVLGTDLSPTREESLQAEISFCESNCTAKRDEMWRLADEVVALCFALGGTPESLVKTEDGRLAASLASKQFMVPGGLSDAALEAVRTHKAILQTELAQMEAAKEEWASKLKAAWRSVDYSEQEEQPFWATLQQLAEKHGACSTQVMTSYAAEIEGVKALRVSKLESLIDKERASIHAAWDRLKCSEAQKREFAAAFNMNTREWGEDMLSLHEAESARLAHIITEAAPLLKLAEKREYYCNQLAEFELSSSDPNRLRSREGFRLLAHEEKMRKVRKVLLPGVESKLLAQIGAWEKAHSSQSFLRYGVPLAASVRESAKERQAGEKAKEKAILEEREARKVRRQSEIGARKGRFDAGARRMSRTATNTDAGRRLSLRDAGRRESISFRASSAAAAGKNIMPKSGRTAAKPKVTYYPHDDVVIVCVVFLLCDFSPSSIYLYYQARTLTPRRATGKPQPKSKTGSFRANTMPARNAARKRKSCDEAPTAPNRVNKPSKSSSSAAPNAKKQKTVAAASKNKTKNAPAAPQAKAQQSAARQATPTPVKEAKVTTGPAMSNLKGMMLEKDPKQQLLELAVQGDTLLAAGQFDQAIAVLTQAIELAQSNKAKSTLHHARSLVYAHEDVEMYDEAVADTDMAIQLNAMRDA
jgi:hypothetical protein